MFDTEALPSLDAPTLGSHIRNFRILQNRTQEEVAKAAGISARTLFQIETGKPVRSSSLHKVCLALNTDLDEFLRRMPLQPSAEFEPIVHSNALSEWYAPIDRRKNIPEENVAMVQDPAERRRLGKLGFTPVFVCYPRVMMPDGPGMTFIELYGRFDEGINTNIYRDALMHCHQGRARFGIAGRNIELGPGDVVGFATQDLSWGESLLEPSEGPVLLTWVGAVRLGKLRPKGGRRTIVRKLRPKV